MRSPTKLMADIAAVLQADSDLNAYVAAQFPGHPLRYYVGVDDEEQPQSSNCPLLAMRPGSFSPDRERSHRPVSVLFALVIEKSGTTSSGTITTLDGMTSIEGLYQRIETAIEDWIKTEYKYMADPGGTSLEIAYPLYRLTWSYTFQEEYP